MCGIYGYFGKVIDGKEEEVSKLIDAMGVYSQRRGLDGSGYFGFREIDGDIVFSEYKKAVPFSFFREDENYSEHNEWHLKLFVGHVRAGSFGGVNDEACHPFVGNRYAMVHNGTSFEALGMASEAGIDLQFGTDSEALHKLMESQGSNANRLFSKISCYSVVYFDKEENTLFFARDTERPMAIFDFRETHGIRVFCSEKRIVHQAAKFAGMDISSAPDPFFTIAHKLYKGDIETGELDAVEEYEPDRYTIDLRSESYPSYPLLDTKAEYSDETVYALRLFKSKKPFQMNREERFEAMKELMVDLSATITTMTHPPTLVDLGEVQIEANNGHASPGENTITLVGNLSIITLLHEFAHLVFGSNERKAVYWSVNLFRKVFTKQFSGLKADRHRLVRT